MKIALSFLLFLNLSLASWSQAKAASSAEDKVDTSEVTADTRAVPETTADAPSVEIAKTPLKNLKESEVPVFQKDTAKKVNVDSSVQKKLMLSLLVVSAIGVCAILFLKRWKLISQADQKKTQIKMLTQFHLGPRKSLAIVRVAGESILIGVTDHNISMIKSLSLIDDEFPEEVPNQFQGTLESNNELQEEEFQLGKIQDQVLGKIKNMRRLA